MKPVLQITLGFVLVGATAGALSAGSRAEAYYHFSLARQARLDGNKELALAEYHKALKAQPEAGAIRAEVADLLRQHGRLQEAQEQAREAVASSPDSLEARRVLAQIYRDRAHGELHPGGYLRRSAEQYEELVRLDPRDRQALIVLMTLYSQLDDDAGAASALERYVQLDPGNVDAYLRLGSHYLAAGRPADASVALQKALGVQPDSAQAHAALGDVYAEQEQTEQAAAAYRRALELDPANLELRLKLGNLLMGAERPADALKQADSILAADPKSLPGLGLRGLALREMKAFDAAREAAEAILEQEPDNPRATYLKVTIAEATGQDLQVVTLVEELLRRAQTSERLSGLNRRPFLIHLGFAQQRLGRSSEAATAFEEALAGDDPDPRLWSYYTEALLRAEDPRALDKVREGRARFPDDHDLALVEAFILHDKGDERGAEAVIAELRAAAPDDADNLLRVANFYQRARRYEQAEATLRRVREMRPRSLRMLFQLGAVLERQDKYDEAETFFKAALEVDPNAAQVLNYLGYMNADRSVRVEAALDLIDRALSLEPDNGAYLDSRGWALYRLGRLEEAEENLRRAAASEPDNAVVLDHLGDVLNERGNLREALEVWRRALQGEDDEDLDRTALERKIKRAQSALDAPR